MAAVTVRAATRAISPSRGRRYWQQLPDGRITLGGFRDLGGPSEWTTNATPTDAVQQMLETFVRMHLQLTAPITHCWAASTGYTETGLPVLEQVREGVWAMGGYSGTGNVIGALSGRAVVAAAIDSFAVLRELARTSLLSDCSEAAERTAVRKKSAKIRQEQLARSLELLISTASVMHVAKTSLQRPPQRVGQQTFFFSLLVADAFRSVPFARCTLDRRRARGRCRPCHRRPRVSLACVAVVGADRHALQRAAVGDVGAPGRFDRDPAGGGVARMAGSTERIGNT